MDLSTAPSGRVYTALPIDATQGFPQVFSFVFNTITYVFSLYVDVGAAALAESSDDLFDLPSENAFLVTRVDTANSDGSRATVFVRKLVPELEYLTGDIALFFPQQTVARENLNGQGEFGSVVIGGIASRWA